MHTQWAEPSVDDLMELVEDTVSPSGPAAPAAAAIAPVKVPDLSVLRAVIDECFPDYWPAVEAVLATAATLLLKHNSNPMALILVGSPSSGKTTVADMLADHALCYRSDKFTVASFVSHAAKLDGKALDKVDLLPRLKHKVLVTPELAPIFRGKEDELSDRFSTLTRVLDGQGLVTDTGMHGQRGYRGDYLFSWLGCTTPFEERVWRVMAQLGSRLFFFDMDDHADLTVADLVAQDEEQSYQERLDRCRAAVGAYLTDLFAGGVRGVAWDTKSDPKPVRERLAQSAILLAKMRSLSAPADGTDTAPAKAEAPRRAHAILGNLARGRALLYGRTQLVAEDLGLVERVVVSSMPTKRRRVFVALVGKGGEPLMVGEAQAALGVSHHETAKRAMEDLDRLGVGRFGTDPGAQAACLRFRPAWAWCAGEPTTEHEAMVSAL